VYPEYSKRERLADGLVHCAGIVFSAAAVSLLMAAAAGKVPLLEMAGLAVYGAGLIAMFVCSAFYHMVQRGPLKDVLRSLDHAAIFVMIAGSYTPFALGKIGGQTGYLLFAAVWSIAVLGVVMKLWFPRRFESLSIGIYLLQGWLIVLALNPLSSAVSQYSLTLLVLGGVIYTLGVVFHLLQRLPFHNAIWHSFVLTAAICHYAAIYDAALA